MKIILIVVIISLTFLLTLMQKLLKLLNRFDKKLFRTLEDKSIFVWSITIIITGLLGAKTFNIGRPIQGLDLSANTIMVILLTMIPFWVFSGYKPGKNLKGILTFCFMFPIAEEILFRGIIQSIAAPMMGTNAVYIPIPVLKGVTLQVFISAICFGITHFQYFDFKLNTATVKKVLFAFLLGLFAGNIVELTNSIFYTVILHIVANTGATLYYLISSRENKTQKLDKIE